MRAPRRGLLVALVGVLALGGTLVLPQMWFSLHHPPAALAEYGIAAALPSAGGEDTDDALWRGETHDVDEHARRRNRARALARVREFQAQFPLESFPEEYRLTFAVDPERRGMVDPRTLGKFRGVREKPLRVEGVYRDQGQTLGSLIESDEVALRAWRRRVSRERARWNSTNRHPRCPASPASPVVIQVQYVDPYSYGYGLEGLVPDCPVPCFRTSSAAPDAAIVFGESERALDPAQDVSPAVRGQWAYENRGRHGIIHRLNTTDFLVSYHRLSDVYVSILIDSWGTHLKEMKCGDPRDHRNILFCVLPFPTLEELEAHTRAFAGAFISQQCDPTEGYFRTRYILDMVDELKLRGNRTIHFWGKCFRTHHLESVKRYSPSYFINKVQTLHTYKFCFCFENNARSDYVTEKIAHCLLSGALPVYFGDPAVVDFAVSRGGFINAFDFKSPAHLADYLVELDENPRKYLEYFKWRTNSSLWNPMFFAQAGYNHHNKGRESTMCRVCTTFLNEFCGGSPLNSFVVKY